MKKDVVLPGKVEAAYTRALDQLQKDTDLESFKKMRAILDKTFGKDNAQIVKLTPLDAAHSISSLYSEKAYTEVLDGEWIKEKLLNAGYRLIVRFPEIEIQNSRKKKHIIRDLFVQIPITSKAKLINALEGTRTTLTPEEVSAQYSHSHLRSDTQIHVATGRFETGRGTRFGRFCTGHGPINGAINICSVEAFSEVNFTFFCLHLKNFVAWESIEGTPYMNFQEVLNRRGAEPPLPMRDVDVEQVYSVLEGPFYSLPDSKIKEMFNVSIAKSEVVASPTPSLEKELVAIITAASFSGVQFPKLQTFCQKDRNGNYFRFNVNPAPTVVASTDPVLIFKGEYQFLKIVNDTEALKPEKYAHPQITQEFVRRFSQRLTETAIRLGENSDSGNSTVHLSQTPAADLTPVLRD